MRGEANGRYRARSPPSLFVALDGRFVALFGRSQRALPRPFVPSLVLVASRVNVRREKFLLGPVALLEGRKAKSFPAAVDATTHRQSSIAGGAARGRVCPLLLLPALPSRVVVGAMSGRSVRTCVLRVLCALVLVCGRKG